MGRKTITVVQDIIQDTVKSARCKYDFVYVQSDAKSIIKSGSLHNSPIHHINRQCLFWKSTRGGSVQTTGRSVSETDWSTHARGSGTSFTSIQRSHWKCKFSDKWHAGLNNDRSRGSHRAQLVLSFYNPKRLKTHIPVLHLQRLLYSSEKRYSQY